jgi:hypothetical protein
LPAILGTGGDVRANQNWCPKAFLCVIAVAGCAIFQGQEPIDSDEDEESDTDTDADSDTDSDSDSDSDSDADSDADSDTDTDADTKTDVDCDESLTPDGTANECLADREVECGMNFLATTEGGTSIVSAKGYGEWYCEWDFNGDYEGPERILEFDHPGGGSVTFHLYSPCGALGLAVIYYLDDESCLADDQLLSQCDWDETSGGDATVTVNDPQPHRYLVVVDTPEGSEPLNYRLWVECPE